MQRSAAGCSGRAVLRRAGGLGLALAIVAAVAAALAVAKRSALAEWWLLSQLAASGVRPAVLRVESVGPAGIAVRDVRLGQPVEASVAAIDAAWSVSGLRAGRLDALRVSGARLRAHVDASGLSAGVLDPLFSGPSGGAVGLPARSIEIRDARAEIASPLGPVGASLAGQIRETGAEGLGGELRLELIHAGGQLRGDVEIAGRLEDLAATLHLVPSIPDSPGLRLGPGLRADGTLRIQREALSGELATAPAAFHLALGGMRAEGEMPAVTLALVRATATAAPELRLEARGGRLTLPDFSVAAGDLALDARWAADALEGTLDVGSLRDASAPPRFAPLAFSGRAAGPLEALDFRLRLASVAEQLAVEAAGSADLWTRSARADLRLRPLVFGPERPRPAALFPVLRGLVLAASGQVEALGTARLEAGTLSGELDVALRDLGFETEWGRVQGCNGRIALRGPVPLTTPSAQLVSVALVDLGLPLVNGIVEFQLRPDGVLEVPRAEWRWAGGLLRTQTSVDARAGTWDAVLSAEDLDVALLLEQVDLEGLDGTGRLSGRIPVAARGEALEVRGGRLASAPPGGTVRYRPSSAAAAAAGSGPGGLGFALDALSDFRYETLELRLDGDPRGAMQLKLHLRGSNPNFQRGRTVELNVNLEARLADLVRAEVATYRMPEIIEKRLRDFSQREKP